MREQPKTRIAAPEKPTVGQLFIGGDWACAHGNFETLQFLARRIVELTPEPLRREVRDLAQRCVTDPDHVVETWVVLKDRFKRGA